MGRDCSVGIASGYGLHGTGISRGLKLWLVAARLLGVRVRNPPEAWMFVLCVVEE